jgi:hypothetical protein
MSKKRTTYTPDFKSKVASAVSALHLIEMQMRKPLLC